MILVSTVCIDLSVPVLRSFMVHHSLPVDISVGGILVSGCWVGVEMVWGREG